VTVPPVGALRRVGEGRLRRKAERELGPKFDIKGFHDLPIGSGSLPLSIPEREVDGWIAARK
jgi:uncharacterized protein (DUF885 family)